MLSLALALTLTAGPDLKLAPGGQEVLRVPGLTKVAVGRPEVADVTPTRKDELLVVGKQLGRTTLTLWTAAGLQTRNVVVDDGKTSDLAKMVRELVGPGLRVENFSGTTIIDGTLDSMDELRRLQQLVGDDGNVKILAHLNPRVVPIVADTITAQFHKQGLKDARAVCVGQKIILEGSVADEGELHKALLIAETYYGQATSGLGVR